jgi:hypothetical protein
MNDRSLPLVAASISQAIRPAIQRTSAQKVSGDDRLTISPGLLQRQAGQQLNGQQPNGSQAAITTKMPVSLRYSDLAGASANVQRHVLSKPQGTAADIFAYSPRTPVVSGLPNAQLEHKQSEQKASFPDSVSSPSLELLKPQRQAEPESAPASLQPIEPADLTEEQISELVKQIPQLDVNQIVDKVTRELERRMRFERQRRGM